jgi:hypothetical protein
VLGDYFAPGDSFVNGTSCTASRSAVEREFGRLKHESSLLPLRVRGLDRVRLHADLTILAKLASALAKTRAVALAALGA